MRAFPIRKRSISLGGRKTSISLEDEFWDALIQIANARGISTSKLMREIEERRTNHNLSSTVRIFILDHYRNNRPTIRHREERSAPLPTATR